MKKRKFFRLALLALSCLGAGNAWAWNEPKQIDGVYQIGTGSELEWFAEKVNAVTAESTTEEKAILKAKVVLTDNIDMAGIDHAPIGANENHKFEGDFDGKFHTIKNLVIDRPNDSQIGLFGWVRGNACIKNVIIDSSCSFTGKNYVGALIGTIQTNVGTSDPLEILNCINYADVTATTGGTDSGASMIGAATSGYPYFEMMNCVNCGTISCPSYAAAFQRFNRSSGGNAKLWNCLNLGKISTMKDNKVNLFDGSNRSIANNYDMVYTGSQYQGEHPTWKTADPLHSGELCYLLNNALREDLKSGQNKGIVSYKQDLSDPTSIPLPIPDGKVVYQRATYNCDGTPNGEVEYTNKETAVVIPPHDFNEKTGFCTYCSKINENWKSPEADGFYHLSTVEDVEWFSHMVRDAKHGAMKVKLDNDIDFGGVANAHLPIGASAQKFFGHFDGQGHTIKGMVLTTGSKLNDRVHDGQGFFGSVRGGGTDANGTVNNEVIIENLHVDSSCSIEHDNNFAAGIVAHVNSRNDDNSMIIIRNCGNEASVYTTGKQAAGILGCVEGTTVGLQIINCWNKGNITGLAGESAAICGWTGTAKAGITKVAKGCWNIGEVTGMDSNGYNMFRVGNISGKLSPTPENIVDLCQTNGGNQGKVTINTADPIASGELCYLLNEDQSEIVFTQTIGTDAMPVYGKSRSQVYFDSTVDCRGVQVSGKGFNNEGGTTTKLDHVISDEIGMCKVCHTQFQEPATDEDGYYMLKNAGNVEWLSAKVATSGGATLYAKMMNDIDFLGIENLHSPIGINEANKFQGVFDGQGHRVKNLIINRPTENFQGFFGLLRGGKTATVKNLILDSTCSITGYNRIGGIVGAYQVGGGTITLENLVNEATVTAKHQDAGGIVGGHIAHTPTIIIRNCVNTGTITAECDAPYAGALCCYLGLNTENSVIENFLNLGKVVGHEGGNIGRYSATNVTNIIDLSETDNKTQGVIDGLTAEDITSGKLAWYINSTSGKKAFGQLIGEDAYPSPLNATEVRYVGDAGYATLCNASEFALNGDVQASIITGAVGTKLVQEYVTNVPAGVGVLLEGTYYNIVGTTGSNDDCTGNKLVGVTADMPAKAGTYVLQNNDGKVGFYLVADGAEPTIKAWKAYLALTGNEAKALFLDGDGATGITEMAETATDGDAEVYNLAGQRVSKATKGIYIVGGKKVLR